MQDTETAYGREVAIIREKSRAAGSQCRHKLESIRRLDSRCGSQLITRNFRNADTATLREKCFIAPGQQVVSGTVRNDQDLREIADRRTRSEVPTHDGNLEPTCAPHPQNFVG